MIGPEMILFSSKQQNLKVYLENQKKEEAQIPF